MFLRNSTSLHLLAVALNPRTCLSIAKVLLSRPLFCSLVAGVEPKLAIFDHGRRNGNWLVQETNPTNYYMYCIASIDVL